MRAPRSSGTKEATALAKAAESPPGLVERIVQTYYAHSGGVAPVVLMAEKVAEVLNLRWPDGWDVAILQNSDLAERANAEREARAVVLLPEWHREKSERRPEYDQVLSRCTPTTSSNPLVAVLPAIVMTENRRDLREHLFTEWATDLVAFAPGGIEGVNRRFVTTVVALQPPDPAQQAMIRFFAAESRDGLDESIENLTSLLRMKGGSRQGGFVLRERTTPGDRMGFGDHDPALRVRREQLAAYGDTVELGELFDAVFQKPIRPHVHVSSDTPGAVRVLSGKDIQRNGVIAPIDADASMWAEAEDRMALQAGDIVVRALHSLASNVGGFVWAEVGEEDLPLVASQVVLVLRPRGSVPAIKRDFVLRYLRSRHATELFEGSSTGSVARLTRSSMSEMKVPAPDASLEQALAEVAGARDQFTKWSTEAELLLDSVFDEDDAEVARQRLLRDSRLIRWRVEAAHSIETIEGQVRNQFPYPVSLRWRVAESQLSAGVDRDAYTSLLDAAEQMLAYVASIGLAVAHAAGLRLAAVDAIRKKLDSSQGPALGDWVAVIDELGGKKFKSVGEHLGTNDFQNFCRDETLRASVRWLSDRRNDEAHNRRADTVDLPARCQEARSHLLVLLSGAGFLIDLPLLLVTATQWDSLEGHGTIFFRRLAGDHSVVGVEQMTVSDPTIEAGSLYVRDSRQQLHLLRPFLVAQECPICRSLSIFHIDKASRGEVTLKSLENGHTLHKRELARAFRAVGFLAGEPDCEV